MASTAELAPFPGAAPINIDGLAESQPLATRANYSARLWAMKIAARGYVLVRRYLWTHPPAELPTYYKSYPSRPNLEAHVFIPKTYKAGGPGLPLIIDIHGGGFAIGSPVLDNTFNASWAHTHGFVVVSLAYNLAPQHPFPAAVHDVADQIKDVLDDKDLPVDWNRVVVAGYSAGANLALAAPQLHGLANRLSAVVSYYPTVDSVVSPDERDKLAVPHPDGRADMLLVSSRFFRWGYVEPGTPLRDPLLSPRFAARDKLPKHIYLIGAQHDLLCHETWTMAEELAAKEGKEKVEDRRGGHESWECGNVRWRRVMGAEHAFNMVAGKGGAEAELNTRRAADCQADIVEWLKRVAWADKAP